MAENEDGQEKTEEPTSKRLQTAREEGQVPSSKELGTTLVLIGGTGALMVLGSSLGSTLLGLMKFNFDLPREAVFDTRLMMLHFARTAITALDALLPFFAFLAVAAVIGPLLMGGLTFSVKALALNPDRIDPLKGIKRMFSPNSLVELFKSIAKFFLVAAIAIGTLLFFQGDLLGLANAPLHTALAHAVQIIGRSMLVVSSSMIILSLIDVPYQLFEHKKQLRMTKEEIKEEHKNSEGKPEVKRKIRQLQYQAVQRRMMEAIPQADVVITNPEHFSVALKYDMEGSGAPVVVAKGADFVALKIREVANAHQVKILQLPPLARAIYFTTEIDREIPQNLYLAVAQVLAYVFQLKAYEEGDGRKPRPLGKVELPEDAHYDQRGRQRRPRPKQP